MSHEKEPVHIEVDPSGDLLIKVVQRSEFNSFSSQSTPLKVLGYLKVSRQVLIANADHFRAMLAGSFIEAGQDIVEIEKETVTSLEVWFRHFHGTMIDDMYEISVEEVWNIMALGRKRLLHNDRLNEWFAEFWTRRKNTFDIEDFRELLYPCHEFDHPQAFAYVTGELAYESSGHIEEHNPSRHWNMRLPQRITGALNAARGNLRTKLHEAVYINRKFLTKKCTCKEKALFQFELALDKTGVWPLEQHMNGKYKKSLQQVLDGLQKFDYKAPEDACSFCSSDFGVHIIDPAIESVEDNFQGLCLDCILVSKTGDENHDNWKRKRFASGNDWSKNCRINHNQPTWYFSFIARRQQEDAHELERLKRKDESARAEREQKQKQH